MSIGELRTISWPLLGFPSLAFFDVVPSILPMNISFRVARQNKTEVLPRWLLISAVFTFLAVWPSLGWGPAELLFSKFEVSLPAVDMISQSGPTACFCESVFRTNSIKKRLFDSPDFIICTHALALFCWLCVSLLLRDYDVLFSARHEWLDGHT